MVCTAIDADPLDLLRWFVRRWSIAVTFADVRRHLGVETHPPWTDVALARTTPILLGLFALLLPLWADPMVTTEQARTEQARPRGAAWDRKAEVTFSDALGAGRHKLWVEQVFAMSRNARAVSNSHTTLLRPLIELACLPA